MSIGNVAVGRVCGATLGIMSALGSMASAAVISNFTFTGPPWAPNPLQGDLYKQNDFAVFAAQAPSSDTDALSRAGPAKRSQ